MHYNEDNIFPEHKYFRKQVILNIYRNLIRRKDFFEAFTSINLNKNHLMCELQYQQVRHQEATTYSNLLEQHLCKHLLGCLLPN